MTSIAFVGAGPTTLYTLASLLRHVGPDVSITVFEEQRVAGAGSPYRPDWNDPAMLSNIASFEIPPVSETLLDWLVNLPDQERAGLGIAREDLNERAFYPRVVLGQYFRDQLDKLVQRGREAGAVIRLQTGCSVLDVSVEEGGMLVTTSPRRGVVDRALFDHVVLATGHQWPAQQEVRPGYYVTPWPIEALAQTSPVAVGIRGSSLTAVDVAVVLANQHGAFVEDQDGLTYRPNPGTEGFKLTMMSRKGLLPEADFYFPVPHAPLSICTEAAVEALIARGSEGLLDQAFELFWRELGETDPAYVGTLAFAATPEAFGEAYFAERTEGDPFDRAASNLIEARHNHEQAITVPWRDAILRMHEVVAAIVPHLTDRDFNRFNRHLKPVFVDNYASVPHVSIERMLALHAAGKLGLLALGDDYRLDTHRPEGGVVLDLHGQRRHLPVFIEATGQRPLSAIQFPFLSLIEQGVVRDAPANDPTSSPRGLQIDDRFRVVAEGLPRDRLFCLSLPFIMGRHPFVQGITSSHAMGLVVGQALAEAVGRPPSVEIASIAEAA